MEKKNFLRATLLAATLVVAGYGGIKAYDYSHAKKVNSDDAMLIANIEALTDGEDEGGNPCPDPYDVPDHYIQCSSSTATETCTIEGTITVCGKILTGSYKKNKQYSFSVNTYNCDGIQEHACCKQSEVRVDVTPLS